MSRATKQRPTIAQINLDSLAGNFHISKQFIGTDLMYLAVVKANAYGHGAIECARRLENEGVDWFGVAIPEEGVELRKAGIAKPILCLGSFWQGQEVTLIVHNLTPVIFDDAAARSLDRVANDANRVIDIHVKIDTGMGRVGVRFGEARAFAERLKSYANLNVAGLLTHFASAENPAEDEFTNLQIERFSGVISDFEAAGHKPVIFDLANSPGAFRHSDPRQNVVRLGGALYGLLDDIMPVKNDMPALIPVLSLKSTIVHIKSVPAGETLGYGRTFTTTRDSLIALVPIGYADGYRRKLSNRANVIVGGHLAPVRGRISMDWTVIDVTDISGAAVGDEVILIGTDGELTISAADIASQCETIGYEITCGISARVPRVYRS